MPARGNRRLDGKADSGLARLENEPEPDQPDKRLVAVLFELRNLLEDYSPLWYTEEHQRRVESALYAGRGH